MHFVAFLFSLQKTYLMNTLEVSNVEILHIHSEDVKKRNSVVCLEQNGFLLCKRGTISLVMDEHVYNVQEGDLYIYPAFSQTYIHSFSDDLEGIVGRADFDFVLSTLDSIADTQSHVYIRFHPLVSLTPTQAQSIERLIEAIRCRETIQTCLKPQIVSALVQAFCYEVIDAYITNSKEEVQSKKQTRKDKIFQNFLVALHHNFHLHRDVQFYATQQHLTRRYFSTLIHEVSGKTPLQWITLFVITEAKRLLSNPKISVKEVADKLNFTEQSFFGRYFKQYAGCSPSEYKYLSTK
jgi:transcriptional regulator